MADGVSSRPHLDSTVLDFQIGPYSLAAATSYGPRLVSLRHQDGPELLAQLGHEILIEHPDSGTYRFHGGHRLWLSPEVPAITYASDDHPCVVASNTEDITITGPIDAAGFVKELSVSLDGERLVIDHRVANAGAQPISVALWGITQFRLGGMALIPFRGPSPGPSPGADFQADRSLVLWPYTNLVDPRLSWRERAAVIEAVPGPRLKIGSGPSPERLGYLIDRQLFTKEIVPAGNETYPDRGAVAQVFVEDSFCELESVGPIVSLEPRASASHREIWQVTECADLATAYIRLIDEVGV